MGRGQHLLGGTDGLSLPMAAAVAPVWKLLQSANFHYALKTCVLETTFHHNLHKLDLEWQPGD